MQLYNPLNVSEMAAALQIICKVAAWKIFRIFIRKSTVEETNCSIFNRVADLQNTNLLKLHSVMDMFLWIFQKFSGKVFYKRLLEQYLLKVALKCSLNHQKTVNLKNFLKAKRWMPTAKKVKHNYSHGHLLLSSLSPSLSLEGNPWHA